MWNNFSQEEQRKILDADRSNNFLDTTKLTSLYPEIKNIKESIRDCLIQYAKGITNSEINLFKLTSDTVSVNLSLVSRRAKFK